MFVLLYYRLEVIVRLSSTLRIASAATQTSIALIKNKVCAFYRVQGPLH